MGDAKTGAFKFVITMVEWSEEIVNQFKELGPTAGDTAKKCGKFLNQKGGVFLNSFDHLLIR